jgi:hypothetical protein
MNGPKVDLTLSPKVTAKILLRQQHLCGGDITQKFEFFVGISSLISLPLMVGKKRTVIREQGVRELVEDGETLALWQAVATVLDPRRTATANQNPAVPTNIVLHFFASDTEDA